MALDALQQYITVMGHNPRLETSGANTDAGKTVPIVQNNDNVPSDYNFEKSNDQHEEKKTKRTVNELYETIRSACSQYGLKINDVKKYGLLSAISGKSEEELLNAEPSEINNIKNNLERALKAIHEDIADIRNGKKELTLDLVTNYARLLNGSLKLSEYSSVEAFRKQQRKIRDNGKSTAESLSERIKVMYNCDINELSKEERLEKLKAYFNDTFLNSTDDHKNKKFQLSDFEKLLFNSSKEERDLLREAIKFLYADNRFDGYKSILDTITKTAEKIEFCNKSDYEYIKALNTTPDKNGKVPDITATMNITALAFEYKDEEHIKDYRKNSKDDALEFYTPENIAKLNAIKQKDQSELTKEELKLLALDIFLRGDNAGQVAGVGVNKVVDETTKKELLDIICSDINDISQKAGNDFYKDVMNEVSDYIEEHPETLTMSPEDFYKLMDEVTDGKFTDIYNNLHPDNPLNYKSATTSAPTSDATATPTAPGTQTTYTSVYETPSTPRSDSQEDLPPSSNYTTVQFSKNSTPFSPILKKISNLFGLNNNENKKIKDVGDLIKIIQNDEIDEETKKFYSKLPANLQENVLRKVSPKKFQELIKETDEKLVMTLKPNDFINAATNNYLLNQQQEIIKMKYLT